ncbi:MAG: hypothetical protein WCK42_01730 [Myxococcaceae bacterium]
MHEMHEIKTETPKETGNHTPAPVGDSLHITQQQESLATTVRPPDATLPDTKTIQEKLLRKKEALEPPKDHTEERLAFLNSRSKFEQYKKDYPKWSKFYALLPKFIQSPYGKLSSEATIHENKYLRHLSTDRKTEDISTPTYLALKNSHEKRDKELEEFKSRSEIFLEHSELLKQQYDLQTILPTLLSKDKKSTLFLKTLDKHTKLRFRLEDFRKEHPELQKPLLQQANLYASKSELSRKINTISKRRAELEISEQDTLESVQAEIQENTGKFNIDSAISAIKVILSRPNSFGLALAKNLEDLNTKMRIAQAKIDKKYFSSGYTKEEADEQKALETEYQEVLKLIIPPEKVDLRSFDQMRQKMQSGGTNSD